MAGKLQTESACLGGYIGKIRLVYQQDRRSNGGQPAEHLIQMMLICQDIIQAGDMQHSAAPGDGEDIIAQLHDVPVPDSSANIICDHPVIVISQDGHCGIPGAQSSQRPGQLLCIILEDVGDEISGYGHKIRLLPVHQIHDPLQALGRDPLTQMDVGDVHQSISTKCII
ncbi:Uncharacterised protein [uncultured archaeon]|nr:Uncharacterised protein [uncultured archaeon]